MIIKIITQEKIAPANDTDAEQERALAEKVALTELLQSQFGGGVDIEFRDYIAKKRYELHIGVDDTSENNIAIDTIIATWAATSE